MNNNPILEKLRALSYADLIDISKIIKREIRSREAAQSFKKKISY